jgi:hypothetical protein
MQLTMIHVIDHDTPLLLPISFSNRCKFEGGQAAGRKPGLIGAGARSNKGPEETVIGGFRTDPSDLAFGQQPDPSFEIAGSQPYCLVTYAHDGFVATALAGRPSVENKKKAGHGGRRRDQVVK